MDRPDIEGAEKSLKRGTGYRHMQDTALMLIDYIHQLEGEIIAKDEVLYILNRKDLDHK